jgi:hypothetical protein
VLNPITGKVHLNKKYSDTSLTVDQLKTLLQMKGGLERGVSSNFIPLEEGITIVHRTYSTLAFAVQIDSDESELGILDLI